MHRNLDSDTALIRDAGDKAPTQVVFESLQADSRTAREIVAATQLSLEAVMTVLTRLSTEGRVTELTEYQGNPDEIVYAVNEGWREAV